MMRKLTKKEISNFKKMRDDIDKEIEKVTEGLGTLSAIRKGLDSYIKTKKAYHLEDLKFNTRKQSKG